MKVLLLIIAILVVFSQAKRDTQAEDIIRGIIQGSYGDIADQVHDCIQDGSEILKSMRLVAIDFADALKNGNEASFLEAFEYVGDILRIMSNEIKDCGDFEEMIKDIPRMADQFTYPEPIIVRVNKVIWRGNVITKDVGATSDELNQDHFEESGKMIGDIIKLVFFYELQNPIDDATVFFTEFWNKAFNLKLDLKTCETEVTTSVNKIITDGGVLILSKDITEFVSGIKKLIDDAEAIYHIAEDCSEAWPTIKEGLLNLEPFYRNPAGAILAVTKAVVLDPISFPKDMYKLYNALSSIPVNYKVTGDTTGDIVKMILAHMPTSQSS
jgi:hypothetical protein